MKIPKQQNEDLAMRHEDLKKECSNFEEEVRERDAVISEMKKEQLNEREKDRVCTL
jgi:hypothetical protein